MMPAPKRPSGARARTQDEPQEIDPGTRQEAAAYLRCSAKTIDTMANEGTITRFKLNGLVRFDMNEVKALLRNSATA